MTNLKNQVQLIGRLGTEPKMQELSNGSKKVSFSLATNERYKNKAGEWVSETQWHQVVAWNATASYAQSYISKGDEVMLKGKLVHRSYEDKNGVARYVSEVVCDRMMKLSKNEKAA